MEEPAKPHEDLVLATACARGDEAAWEEFHAQYRRFLVDLAGDTDTADQIIAELYQGQIASYRGRSSLKGWLRAVVYQAKVDRHRREGRLMQIEALPVEPARSEHPENFERRDNAAALARALRAEVDELPPGQRLLLAWYYVDQLRLAQIARLRGVHESTISRELDSIRKMLRKRVEKRLRTEGFSSARIEECFRHATDAPFELARQETSAEPY
jgi:RNA polymerase sigma factor (sigma-70 family)